MLDFDFLKIAEPSKRIFEGFPLPAMAVDRRLRVYWSNTLAKNLFPYLSEVKGLQTVLAELDAEALFVQLEKKGSWTVTDVLPLSGLRMSLLPIENQGRLMGAVALLIGADALLDNNRAYQTTRTASALSTGIYQAVEEVFGIMDIAARKADMMNAGWIKPNFERISLYNYRILRMADNIAAYARLQNGSLDLQYETWDLFELLEDLREAAEVLTQPAGISVELDIPQNEWAFVSMDRGYLEMALLNLLHNAFYYTRPGNRVSIRACMEGAYIRVSVEDRGLGIPAHVLPHVLRPYMAYDHSGKRQTAGLGLTLSDAIIRAHGGQMDIQSEDGEGTLVTLLLEKDAMPRKITLGQAGGDHRLDNRFSAAYTGLYDVLTSPYL